MPFQIFPSMPRFLDTLTGSFVFEDNPSSVHYAILSHTWRRPADGGEQSFHDIQKLQAAVDQFRKDAEALTAPGSPRDSLSSKLTIFDHSDLSEKIRGICKVAYDAGYRLLWIDACCINQSDSAELSEAINSMFEWYRLADVCYVYLPDVPTLENPTHLESRFRRSRWHERGWTLQELIAPEHVIFLTGDWRFLGTRTGLASTLEQVTGVDFDILTGMAPLSSISVARRMSWAARRKTSRVEDRAYSLLGIFGVHLSPIYGEGGNAFLRLQGEIIRMIPDQSVFAWGPSSDALSETSRSWWVEPNVPCLLASSPSAFEDAGDVKPLSPSEFVSRLRLSFGADAARAPSLNTVFTPQGVRLHLICVDLKNTELLETILHARQAWMGGCDLCNNLPHADSLALLQCQNRAGSLVCLPLCRRTPGLGPEEEAYAIAPFMGCGHWLHEPPFRTVHLTRDVFETMTDARLSKTLSLVREVSLLRYVQRLPDPKSRQPHFVKDPSIELWSSNPARGPAVVFVIAAEVEQELRVLGFALSPLRRQLRQAQIILTTVLTTRHHNPVKRSQRIHIRLTLTHIPPREQSGDLDTAARFSIENYIRPPADADAPATPAGSPVIDLHEDLSAYLDAPCADDSEETRISEFSSRSSSQRILVEATFIVHADDNWEKDAFDLRRLRLRLERPWARSAETEDTVLQLSVEISERFRYERPAGWELHTSRGLLGEAEETGSEGSA